MSMRKKIMQKLSQYKYNCINIIFLFIFGWIKSSKKVKLVDVK